MNDSVIKKFEPGAKVCIAHQRMRNNLWYRIIAASNISFEIESFFFFFYQYNDVS